MDNVRFDINKLRKYVQGELSASEMHEIEVAAHENEMLADILMGLEYENEHKLSAPDYQLQQRIKQQSSSKKDKFSNNIISFSALRIAASFLFIIGVGAYFYINYNTGTQTDNNSIIAQVEENKPAESVDNKAVLIDSISSRSFENKELEKARAEKRKKTILPDSENDRPSALLATIPATKNIQLNNRIEHINFSSANSSNSKDELIIVYNNNNTLSDLNKQEALLAETKDLRSKYSNTPLAAQQRARVNSLMIDPYIQNMLNDVVEKQAREESRSNIMTNADKKQHVSIDSTHNLVAKRKYREGNIAAKQNTIEAKPTEISILNEVVAQASDAPINGLKTYTNNLKSEISKATTDSFSFKIQFKTTKEGQPYAIQFLKSSHPTLEQVIKNYLLQAEKWNKVSENEYIQLTIEK